MHKTGSHEDFQCGHTGIGGRILESTRDALPGDLIRRETGKILPLKQNLPGLRLIVAGNTVNDGGLAGAVGANQGII